MKLETALKPVTEINSKVDQRLKCTTRKILPLDHIG